MKVTTLTRRDEGFDSIAWALEVHVKKPNEPAFNYALMYGNEDAPDSIDFWYDPNPSAGQSPDWTWENVVDPGIHIVTLTLKTEDPRKLDDMIRLVLGLKGLLDYGIQAEFMVLRSESLDEKAEREDEEPF